MKYLLALGFLVAACGPERGAVPAPASSSAPVDPSPSASAVPSASAPVATAPVATGAPPAAPIPPPEPVWKLTTDQAGACAETLAAKLQPRPELKPAFKRDDQHWFTFKTFGRTLAVVVDDEDCTATLAPAAGSSQSLADVATARRYLKLADRAWRVVNGDRHVKAYCAELEDRKAQHPNLQGCVAWVDHYPEDLCTDPIPKVDPKAGPSAQWAALAHRCLWTFYVGEDMTTHTNNQYRLVVDAERGQLIGVRTAGGPITAKDWYAGVTDPLSP